MTMFERRKLLFRGTTDAPAPVEYIRPVKAKFTVMESVYDEEPRKCWAKVTSDTLYHEMAVLQFIEHESGLEDWYVTPGYPYLNKNGLVEWKLVRYEHWNE